MTTTDIKLSPSSINTYFRSPRLFYYQYILKLPQAESIHLYKGNFVHSVLDRLFMSPRYVSPTKFCEEALKDWNPSEKMLTTMSAEEKDKHFAETQVMLSTFAKRFDEKIDMILMEGKVRDRNHAWNTIKPKLREHKIYDEERHVVGIIDAVETNFDEKTYIIDYKTSKLYRHTLPEDYIRQVSIYAYLFQKEFGKLPDFAGVHYLRYGEVYMVPVTQAVIDQAKHDIDFVRKNSMSRDVNDYPIGNDQFALKDCEYYEAMLNKKTSVI